MVASPATFRIRYPAFAAVSEEAIQYWLGDAARYVTGWGQDEEPGAFAYAAHWMSVNRVAGLEAGESDLPAGVTSFKSGTFSVSTTEAAANRSLSSGYDATLYGQEFASMQRRHNGGPMLVGYVEPCGLPCW